MKNDRILSLKEIAHQLGCSTRTVRRYHADGKLKTFQAGGASSTIKMRKVDLDRVIRGK
ncbi:helix-turn-helix domain-containing protein [Pararhizobium gei]|uniref:helix-turn-helix domain-containing protein n=1 Tax=Pararhizobium gei TaxID=1395951 RepID=UPI0023DCB072|nr:helix-turn-helix domain-containing protein [Rhizobium gei]